MQVMYCKRLGLGMGIKTQEMKHGQSLKHGTDLRMYQLQHGNNQLHWVPPTPNPDFYSPRYCFPPYILAKPCPYNPRQSTKQSVVGRILTESQLSQCLVGRYLLVIQPNTKLRVAVKRSCRYN